MAAASRWDPSARRERDVGSFDPETEHGILQDIRALLEQILETVQVLADDRENPAAETEEEA